MVYGAFLRLISFIWFDAKFFASQLDIVRVEVVHLVLVLKMSKSEFQSIRSIAHEKRHHHNGAKQITGEPTKT